MSADETTLATEDADEGARFWLVVLHGERPLRVPLAERALVLGRAPPADVVIDAPTLSREHVRVAPRADGRQGAEITDLGSKNGLRVRGERVTHALLGAGDSVEAGGVTMLLVRAPARRGRRRGELSLPALLGAIDDELARQELTRRAFVIAVVGAEAAGPPRAVDRWATLDDGLVCWLLPELEPAEVPRLLRASRVGAVSSRAAESAGALVELARRAWLRPPADAGAAVERGHDEVVAASEAMRATLALAARLATSDQAVLVTGETGSGKELVARHLHARSARARGSFFAINCAAVPSSLVESTFFGHERGAFTGASERRTGAFEEAHGGTLFLDEVGELAPAAQAVLLRVLETGTLLRVGGTREVSVDVRLVAATHRDLRVEVAEGRFRSDLLHRLGVLELAVPPLRDRPEDVVALARAFARRAARRASRPEPSLEPDAVQVLLAYDWPGNARELRNVIERAVLLGSPERLTAADVAPHIPVPARGASVAVRAGDGWNLRSRLRDVEAELIVGALETTGGNVVDAAQLLGIPRRTLAHKIGKLGIRRRWDRG